MDFELSEDQVGLQAAARDLLDDHASPARVRAVVDAGGAPDPKLWDAIVQQGWPAVVVPESLGGLGLGWVEVAVLLEEVGRHVAPVPFLSQVVALDALVHADSLDAGDLGSLLGSLIDGSATAAVAFGEVDADSDADSAGPAGDGGTVRLTGRAEPVVFGPDASVVVVRGGDALYLFEADALAAPVEAQPAMDRTRRLGWLTLDGTPARRLGGADLIERYLDAGAVAYAAELLGIAAAALDLAVAYAKDREQFGRPIGSFQAVKHRCADMLVDVEGMRSTVYHAAWTLAADHPDRSIAASTAKTWCSDAARRVTASCLQVHGGIGFTWESDVHLYLKRAQLDEVSFGDAVFHRARLARLLRARVEAGESVI